MRLRDRLATTASGIVRVLARQVSILGVLETLARGVFGIEAQSLMEQLSTSHVEEGWSCHVTCEFPHADEDIGVQWAPGGF